MSSSYAEVKGPQQRRRILREIGREEPRKEFSHSKREVRLSLSHMFGFTPLVVLSEQERRLLKAFTKRTVTEHMGHLSLSASEILSGKAPVLEPDGSHRAPSRGEVRGFFTSGRIKGARFNIGALGSGSRGIKGYLSEGGFDVLNLARSAFAKKKSIVKVLDVGSANANMLTELKNHMGETVETHALSPADYPRDQVDHYHMLTAEYLPVEFRRKFDLILSHRALEYAVLPHLALRNISEALAPGGKAYVQWRPQRVFHPLLDVRSKALEAQTSSFYEKMPVSKAAIEIMKEALVSMSGAPKSAYTDVDVQQLIADAISTKGWEARHSLAWWEEVARLRKDPKLKVELHDFSGGVFGAPRKVYIERIS